MVAASILNLFKESVEFNLAKLLPEFGEKVVTGSAFTQARYKINSGFFRDINGLLTGTHRDHIQKTWKGHTLYAGDGSTVNLPPSAGIKSHFGIHSSNKFGVDRCLARVVFIYNVLDDFVYTGAISKMEKGEKTLLMESLKEIPTDKEGILILDRGFGDFCTIKALMDRQWKTCVRMSVEGSNFAKSAMEDERGDFITEWVPSEKSKENSRKKGAEHSPVKVRVTKIMLDSGETELLITNLYDRDIHSPEDIGELYSLRWGVEEGFKNLKPKMKLEHFGCRKPEGIYQEFHAHIFCMNLVSLVGSIANETIQIKTAGRKLEYRYNWKNAYRFVRTRLVAFLTRGRTGELLELLYNEISASVIAIKPGRKFNRDMRKSSIKGRITPNYK